MKKIKYILIFIITFFILLTNTDAATNPYGKYQNLYGKTTVRCTWYAWGEAYEKGGVALPGWGNAQTWYASARNAGYSVGREAKANSIAVWSSSDGYGHVAYVVSVSEDYMIINEGGAILSDDFTCDTCTSYNIQEGYINGKKELTNADNLIGYIYLDDAPKTPKNNTSTNTTTTTTKKDNNNNLSSISINEEDLEFEKDTLEYTYEVAYNVKIANIKAATESEKTIVEGMGDKALKVGENIYTLESRAEDGTTKEYKITIIRQEYKEQIEETKEINNSEETVENNQKNINTKLIIGIALGVGILIILVIVMIKKKGGKHEKDIQK